MTDKTITFPDDGTEVVTVTAGQLRAAIDLASQLAVKASAQAYAQAGADAVFRYLNEKGLIRTTRPVEVSRVQRDERGLITAVVKTIE